MNEILELSGITKIFTDEFGVKKKVLENISFTIAESGSKITSILASFGGGKSTLLKVIAGVENPTSGGVFLGGEKYLRAKGKIVLIPEKSTSLPWLNVRENIELGSRLEYCRMNSESYEINDLISLVGLTGYENHYPHNQSFGFRFRISLARALLFNPVVLLLDDCFKKMDATTREEIYSLIKLVSEKVDSRFIIATTNIIEAIKLSGKILMMSKNPAKIYKEISISEKLTGNTEDEKFIEYRRLIENAYNEEKQPGTINFSI